MYQNGPFFISCTICPGKAKSADGNSESSSLILADLGSYEGWSNLVREAVVWCGLPDPGETRQELVVVKPPDLPGAVLDDGVAERDLAVSGQDRTPVVTNGEDCRAVDHG